MVSLNDERVRHERNEPDRLRTTFLQGAAVPQNALEAAAGRKPLSPRRRLGSLLQCESSAPRQGM